MRCLIYLPLLFVRSLLTPIKKLFSFLIYPFAYLFRSKVQRGNSNDKDYWQIPQLKQKRIFHWFIWLFLDDSIYDNYKKEYHPTKHQCKLNQVLCKFLPEPVCEFLHSWYWSGIRNSSNNLSHLLVYLFTGKKVNETICFHNKWITYKLKQFERSIRPYLEIKIGQYIINVGWLNSGKFEGPKIRRLK